MRLMLWLLAGIALAANAADAGQSPVTSTPSGAVVCRKVLEREECLGKTPLLLPSTTQRGSSQRYIFKKLGYRSRSLYIDAAAPVDVKLEKAPLLPDAESLQDTSLRELQRTVNERLSTLIYGSQLTDDGQLETLGPSTVYRSGTRPALRFAVAVSNYELLRQLKTAGRKRDFYERHGANLELFIRAGAFTLFDRVRQSLAGVPLDLITFDVMYVRSAATLDFDEVQTLQRTWVGTRYSRNEQIDTYVLWMDTQDVTVVRDEKRTINYSFAVDRTAATGLAGQLATLTIASNDTPNGAVVRIDNAKLPTMP